MLCDWCCGGMGIVTVQVLVLGSVLVVSFFVVVFCCRFCCFFVRFSFVSVLFLLTGFPGSRVNYK